MEYTFIPDRVTNYFGKVNQVLNAALLSVNPRACVKRCIQIDQESLLISGEKYLLSEIQDILVIGAGKAVMPMALGAADQLEGRLTRGHLITKHLDTAYIKELPGMIIVSQGDHPIPSDRSVIATRQMITLAETDEENDLVVCLISGGGSALMTLPSEGIKLEHVQELTEHLLRSGANIEEINTIRKHLDRVKGGGLLKSIFPAKSISLILSDVLGDHIPSIASGPTAADPSSYHDAMDIVNKYRLQNQVNPVIINYISEGMTGKKEETLKYGDPILANHKNVLIGSLRTAAEAAADKAKELGFHSELLSLDITGEASDVGRSLGEKLRSAISEGSLSKPVCMVAGGEPTVTIRGQGKGGRNQEVALSAAQELEGFGRCLFISLATDGEDGPTDAAGGFVTGDTIVRGKGYGLDSQAYLDNNDSYHYLEQTDALIRIGPTGTNVNDLYLMIAY
jgi:hydroxypyruvate reductase